MKIIISILCIALFVSCVQETKHAPYENNLHLSPAYMASLDTSNYTIIQWIDSAKDFGTIKEGDSVRLSYRFKNVGDKPLFLSKVQTSCGCTITKFPQNAIFSGKEDSLAVTFNSKGHPGSIFKNVLVISNTSNKVKHFVEFSGTVLLKK